MPPPVYNTPHGLYFVGVSVLSAFCLRRYLTWQWDCRSQAPFHIHFDWSIELGVKNQDGMIHGGKRGQKCGPPHLFQPNVCARKRASWRCSCWAWTTQNPIPTQRQEAHGSYRACAPTPAKKGREFPANSAAGNKGLAGQPVLSVNGIDVPEFILNLISSDAVFCCVEVYALSIKWGPQREPHHILFAAR